MPWVKSILNKLEIFQPQRSTQDFLLKLQIYQTQKTTKLMYRSINFSTCFTLKVSKSRKQFMVSWILPKNERKQFDLRYHSSAFEIYWPLKNYFFDYNSCYTYFRRSFNFEKTGEVFANVFRSFLKSYPKIIRRPRGWLITDSMNVLHSLELSDSIGKHSISIRNICNKENIFRIELIQGN